MQVARNKLSSDCSRALSIPDWPAFADDEIEAAIKVLRSGKVNYWTGSEVRHFEAEFAAACDVNAGLAVANGTIALESSLEALGIGPGDEVIVPGRGFVGCASSVVRVGAVPIFADVCPNSQNLTVDTIEPHISKRTKAFLLVHLAGWPADMDGLVDLARHHNCALIEDCSQAHGGMWKGRPVGSFGDVGIFSFCNDKIMTTAGEGGMIVSNSDQVIKRVFELRDHGRSCDADSESPGAEFRYLRNSIGSNHRMTELQAAIGRLQLRKLETWVLERNQNAACLEKALIDHPAIRISVPSRQNRHARYRFYGFIESEQLKSGWNRNRIIAELNEAGIPAQAGSCPEIYREKAFQKSGLQPESRLPVCVQLGATSIALPVHPGISQSVIREVALTFREILNHAVLS